MARLNQMAWMQFVLDSYTSAEEVIRSASKIGIEVWGWHHFVDGLRAADAVSNRGGPELPDSL